MAVLTLASASGAPGVTTTSLGLALCWPRRVLLADCDRDPARAVLAGYLNGVENPAVGIGTIGAAYRERRLADMALERNAISLPTPWREAEAERLFLPGFAHWGSALLFDSVWPLLARLFSEFEGDVIIDAGRVGRSGLPEHLLAVTDKLVLVVRPTLPAISAVGLLLAAAPSSRVPLTTHDATLLLVGAGRPYGEREVAAELGAEIVAVLPDAPREAAVLSEGRTGGTGLARSPYFRSLRSAAVTLAAELPQSAPEIAS